MDGHVVGDALRVAHNLDERGAQVSFCKPVERCRVQGCSYLARHLKRLVEHMMSMHHYERSLRVFCNVSGCCSLLSTADSFRTHVIRYHRQDWNAPLLPPIQREEVMNIEQFPLDLVEYCDAASEEKTADQLYTDTCSWVRSQSLLLRLDMEHRYEVPAAVVKGLHEEVKKFITSFQYRLSATMTRRLEELGAQDGSLLAYAEAGALLNALNVTKTQAKKKLESLEYVQPTRVQLRLRGGSDVDEDPDLDLEEHEDVRAWVGAVVGEGCKRASGVMHYVSILDTLKAYLSHDDVVCSIRKELVCDSVLSGYTSGVAYQNHPVFRNNPNALRIVLYMDELEVCNPIGGNRGKHKLTGVYFSVGNVEQHYLSSLSSIHLALLCEYPNVKKYGYHEILKPVIRDLAILQNEGIHVKTKSGEECHWYGALAYVCGDNATHHEVGGFRRTFSSGKVCRFCMADYSEFPTLLTEDQCVTRTPSNHAYHVRSVLADSGLTPVYGVTGESPFQELGVGSVVELLTPDVLHDILEGQMSTHLTLLIKQLHRDKIVKLREIRALTDGFPYGDCDKRNRHPGIPEKFMRKGSHLIGSASQRWALFYIFPLAIGGKVKSDNKYWLLFILATRIFEIIMAPVIERDWVPYVRDLIEEHHAIWVTLYPNVATYKWHVLLHYPRILLMLGPLRLFWTMRFENFHQFFKRMARKLMSFTCISKTLSVRFQRKRCLEFAGEGALPPEVVLLGRQTTCRLVDLDPLERMSLGVDNDAAVSRKVLKVRAIVYRGMKFISGCYVVVRVLDDGVPIFFKITKPCLLDGEVVLFGWMTYVAQWDPHVNAYKVDVSSHKDDFVCLRGEEVCSPQTLDGYSIGGFTYIKMRFLPSSM